jgi:hypothetical protein
LAVTGTWRITKPVGSEPIRDSRTWIPDNLEYIETWFGVEHVFPGSIGQDAGHHRPGSVTLLKYGASSQVGSMTGVPSGALAYITGASAPGASIITHGTHGGSVAALRRFVYCDGTVWQTFPNLLHAIGGSMTGDLDVQGTNLDGRAPSADGTKLDTMSQDADTCGVSSDLLMSHGGNLTVPSTPSSADFTTGDCKWMAVQCSGSSGASTKVTATGGITALTTAMAFVIGVK